MVREYGQSPLEKADCIVVLSGDGMVLRTFHETFERSIPIYGMNRGEVGFLTNPYVKVGLIEKIKNAVELKIHPLRIIAIRDDGESFSSIAINEVYLLRETHQSAKIRVHVDGKVRLKELVCDGIITATPLGSTAYNYSASGPILPVRSNLLALTPISPFRPRCWRGALIRDNSQLRFDVLDHKRRPVCAVADYVEYRQVSNVLVFQDRSITLSLLFDKENRFEDKVLEEQFAT